MIDLIEAHFFGVVERTLMTPREIAENDEPSS